MMRRITLSIFLCVLAWALVSLLFTLGVSQAQAPAGKTPVSDLERPIRACEQQVASWRREEVLEIVFVLAVSIFGIVISYLQKSDAKWSKTATVVLGISTAILTAVNSRVFSADDRTLRHAVFEGSTVISQLWIMDDTLKDEHVSPQDKLNVKGDYLKKLLEFQAIGERLNGASSENSGAQNARSGFEVLPRVFASVTGSVPAWVDHPPSDNASLYFVGKAYDTSLTSAKQNSVNDAYYRAAQVLKKDSPQASGSALLDLIKASAVVQDSAYSYDSKTGNYTCYTLLRVSREIQGIGLGALPALSVAQTPPAKVQTKGWQPGDLTANATSGLFVLDSGGGVSKLALDPEGQAHVEKLFQLKNNDQGDALTASADFVFVASSSRLGCTVYKYSLASKAVASRLLAVHERCVGIANDGKAVYVTLPDRKEIRYLDSWDSSLPHSWQVTVNSSPGFLTYDAIGQRLIVADDTGKAYSISVPDGKAQELASNLGSVQSIATSKFHILIASGTKVLFLARSDNHGENPPADLQTLTGGHIVGVAVDANDRLWYADYDNKLVQGPYPLL